MPRPVRRIEAIAAKQRLDELISDLEPHLAHKHLNALIYIRQTFNRATFQVRNDQQRSTSTELADHLLPDMRRQGQLGGSDGLDDDSL